MAEKYNSAIQRFWTSEGVDWDSGLDIRMLLLKDTASGPVFDPTHATVAAVLAHVDNVECDDASYARVAIPEADRSLVLDGRTRKARIANPADFGALDNEDVGAAVIYIHVGADDASNVPLAYSADNFPQTANGAGFTVGAENEDVMETEGVAGA